MNTWIDSLSRRLALRRARRAGPPPNDDDGTGPNPAAYPMTRRQLVRYAFNAVATTSVLGTLSLGRLSGTAFALDFPTCIAQMQALGFTIGSNPDNAIPSSTPCRALPVFQANRGVICADGTPLPGFSGCVGFHPTGSTPTVIRRTYHGGKGVWCRDYWMEWHATRGVDMLRWRPPPNETCVQAEVDRWQDDLCTHELLHVEDLDRIMQRANTAWRKQTICILQKAKPKDVEFDQRAISDAELYRQAMETEFNMLDAGGNNISLPNCGTQTCSTCLPSTYCGIGGLSPCPNPISKPDCYCWNNTEGYPRCFYTPSTNLWGARCLNSAECPGGYECAAGHCDGSRCMPLCS